MVDLEGTTIVASDTVACSVKVGANKHALIVGVIGSIATDNGETYLHVNLTTRHRMYNGDYARVHCDATDGKCYNAIKVTATAAPTNLPLNNG